MPSRDEERSEGLPDVHDRSAGDRPSTETRGLEDERESRGKTGGFWFWGGRVGETSFLVQDSFGLQDGMLFADL